MPSVLAIDAGTTGSTALVVAADGRVLGRGYREIAQHYPAPGLVEQDPEELFASALAAARDAIAAAGEMPVALGITNQRETVIVWERSTGRPLHRAIVWQDRRTSDRCRELAPHEALISRRTGLVIDPYFSATKLEWLLQQPAISKHAVGDLAAGTVDSWLVWRLTDGAVHATDPTNASRTMLYDIDERRWSDELCDLFSVPRSMLPDVRPSLGSFGAVAARHLGAEVPILGIAGDQQSALFGQGCVRAGESKNTYGTGAFVLLNAGATRPEAAPGVLTTIACGAEGEPVYALEGAIFIAGAAVQWLRDGLHIVEKAAETEALARSVDSTGGVYFVPALVGLGAPAWEPRARGTIVGITRGTTHAHLARAALESMAYATHDVLALMSERAGVQFPSLRVDGGASHNDWLMQFQADVLGVPVERPDLIETTALGAAALAGIGAGLWPSIGAFVASRTYDTFTPGDGAPAAREGIAGWARAVRATVHWARDEG